MMRMLSWIPLLLCLLMGPARAADTISIYTNATSLPLFSEGGRGLYPEMVAYLNRLKLDGMVFRLEHLPRKRMQVLLDENRLDGAIIGMMPRWFGDESQQKYLWTQPFFLDSFVLVSPAAAPLNFGPGAVKGGSRIGVTLGYVYPGIDEWIAQSGLLRSDAPSEELNIEKLLLGRVDGVVVTASVLRHYLKSHQMALKLQVSPLPGQQTERRFLVPHGRRDLYDKLAPVIRQLKDDPEWQAIRARYE